MNELQMYCLKDNEGVLRPLAFMCYPDMIEYQKKEIDKATKDGSTIVLVDIKELTK